MIGVRVRDCRRRYGLGHGLELGLGFGLGLRLGKMVGVLFNKRTSTAVPDTVREWGQKNVLC